MILDPAGRTFLWIDLLVGVAASILFIVLEVGVAILRFGM